MISKGVMQTSEWTLGQHKHGNGAIYRIACSCSDPDCDAVILFDLEDGIFTMHMYKKLSWEDHWKKEWWHQRMWLRLKAVVKLLFTGFIELEDDIVVDYKYIPDLIEMYQEAQENIDNYNKEQDKLFSNTKDVTNDNRESAGQ